MDVAVVENAHMGIKKQRYSYIKTTFGGVYLNSNKYIGNT